ncbi:ubiquitin-protein ligase E3B [Caerostris extrusa]|uniref:HECT-type E3 ubiquitin transferase n=1 Tax=Caerostris extrusa TaxID=172846 RepID=A0AAV4RP19_CAEEX|nr:ubiquitin-protein ligase E3B [Caerostris extrusa]
MFEISTVSTKDQFLEQAKAARLERALERKREQATIVIQAYTRSYFARKKLQHDTRKEFDETILEFTEVNKLPPSIDMYKVIRRLMFIVGEDSSDKERFEKICRYIIASIDTDSLKLSSLTNHVLQQNDCKEDHPSIKMVQSQSSCFQDQEFDILDPIFTILVVKGMK